MQLLVAPLQKLTPKANATIKDVGTIDSLVQSFGPYITGMVFAQALTVAWRDDPDSLNNLCVVRQALTLRMRMC